jgi:hypothetical protein
MASYEIGHLEACPRRVEHLEKGNAVDPNHRVVTGDHLLTRYLDDPLHHLELAADVVDEGNDQREPRTRRAYIAAEALDRVIVVGTTLTPAVTKAMKRTSRNRTKTLKPSMPTSPGDSVGSRRLAFAFLEARLN